MPKGVQFGCGRVDPARYDTGYDGFVPFLARRVDRASQTSQGASQGHVGGSGGQDIRIDHERGRGCHHAGEQSNGVVEQYMCLCAALRCLAMEDATHGGLQR